jgi:ketosteroid isomerase-like protein
VAVLALVYVRPVVGSGFDPITDELVERSRTMYRMLHEHDAAFLDFFHPALEYHPPASFGVVLHGPWELLELLDSVTDSFDAPRPEPEEFLPSGDALVVLGTWTGTAKATGVRVEAPFAHLQRFRDGKLAHFRVFMDTATHLTALQEQAPD